MYAYVINGKRNTTFNITKGITAEFAQQFVLLGSLKIIFIKVSRGKSIEEKAFAKS